MLLPQHQKLIDESGISPEVAAARGYRSVTVKAELERLGFGRAQQIVPALLVPIYKFDGTIATYQIRPDQPRISRKSGKPIKYETTAGSRMVVDVPPGARPWIGDPSRPLFITEGVRKADSAVSRGLCCVALLGVWNWRGRNEHDGLVALADWELIALKGRKVYLAFDSDLLEKASVQGALKRLQAFLESRGADVVVLQLPPGPGGAKVGLDDFFAAGNDVEELLATARPAVKGLAAETSLPERGRLGRPRVNLCEDDLHFLTLAVWEALGHVNNPPNEPTLFRHGGAIVRIDTLRDAEAQVEVLTADSLRYELVRLLEFCKPEERANEGPRPARPPKDLISNLLACAEPPLPPLSRLTQVPVFDAEGRLVTRNGYHVESKLYLASKGFKPLPLPERIETTDIEGARHLLCQELLGDFPFSSQADLANAMALMILPFVRDMIRGPTPLHLIEKPSPGTGAGLLTDMLAWPALGVSPTLTSQARDEDEWRKRITALLSRGPMVCVIDNLRDALDSAALSAVLTSTYWEDRILGQSKTISLPVQCAWVATGNNPSVSQEIARRTVPIRIDSGQPKPWERPERCFRHPNLRAWARENRAELVRAVLILVRSWIDAGHPEAPDLPVLGSFEEYAKVLGGILAHAGIPGFLRNLRDFYDRADRETDSLQQIIGAWWAAFEDRPVGAAELFPIFENDDVSLSLGGGSLKSRQTKLGFLLRGMRDRRFRLERDGGPLQVKLEHCGLAQRAAQYRLAREQIVSTSPLGRPPAEPSGHEERLSNSSGVPGIGGPGTFGEPGEGEEPSTRPQTEQRGVCPTRVVERSETLSLSQVRPPTGEVDSEHSPDPPSEPCEPFSTFLQAPAGGFAIEDGPSPSFWPNCQEAEHAPPAIRSEVGGSSRSQGSPGSPAAERLLQAEGRDDDCEVIE